MINFAHFIWFQGINYIPKEYLLNINRFKELNPSFQIYFWSETELLELLNNIQKFINGDPIFWNYSNLKGEGNKLNEILYP